MEWSERESTDRGEKGRDRATDRRKAGGGKGGQARALVISRWTSKQTHLTPHTRRRAVHPIHPLGRPAPQSAALSLAPLSVGAQAQGMGHATARPHTHTRSLARSKRHLSRPCARRGQRHRASASTRRRRRRLSLSGPASASSARRSGIPACVRAPWRVSALPRLCLIHAEVGSLVESWNDMIESLRV